MSGPGRYRGRELDLSSRRSIRRRTIAGRDEEWQARHCVVEDFYHEGQFWTAVIPLDSVQAVYGQAFNFSRPRMRKTHTGYEIIKDSAGLPKRIVPWANHVQSRFVLDEARAAELFAPDDRQLVAPQTRVRDFIYSVEAIGPPGVRFNLRDACIGSLICAHRFLSTEEMVFERIVLEGQYVMESPPLELAVDAKTALLQKSLDRSDRAGMTERYYLLRFCGTNNCTSNPLRILDQVVRYNAWQWVAASIYRLPIHPRLYLRVRGLDSDPSVRNQVRHEFESFIRDPATRQRKRAFLKARKQARSR